MKIGRVIMMINKKELSGESTVYHYRLLKRIHNNSVLFGIYWGILVGWFVWELIRLRLVPFLGSLVAVPVMHMVLVYLYFSLKEKRSLAEWTFHFSLPWIGLAPMNHIALRRVRRMHLHLLWITVVISGCLYPWVALDVLFNLLFVHIWIFLPRLIIFFRFRKHQEIGYLKINEKDTSCYSQ
jgi:hypothetical protein